MKNFLITVLLILLGFVASSQVYDMKINKIRFFSYPANVCKSDVNLIDSVKFNESFVYFATVKIDFRNKIIVCGEVNGIKTKTTVFDLFSINNDDNRWSTFDIIGRNQTGIIRFELFNNMLVVSHQEDDTIYGWFDRVVEFD